MVAAVAVLGMVASVVSWLVTRWRVVGDELQIDTGLVYRQSLRFPLRRVQAVDVVAPLTARILGLAEVRVISAGTGHRQHGRLAYLSNQDAAAVRAQLLALAHGLAAETPEPPALPLFRVDNGRLIAASLLRGAWLLVLVVVAVGAILAAVDPTGAGGAVRQGGADAATSLITGVVTGLFALGLDAARSVNGDFDFTIGHAPDGLRLHRGLLQKRHETIPYGRIQAVRLIQPLLWRPFGWARVELDVARQPEARRQGEARQLAHLLAPVATLDQARWLVGQVAPGAPATLDPRRSPAATGLVPGALLVPLPLRLARRALARDPDRPGAPGDGDRAARESPEHPAEQRASAAGPPPRQPPDRHGRTAVGGGSPLPGRGRGQGARRPARRSGMASPAAQLVMITGVPSGVQL